VIDHNNLTMAGGEFTALDMSRMYNMEDYLKLLEGLRVEDDLPETVDADDLALLFEAMAGAFDSDAIDPRGTGEESNSKEVDPDDFDLEHQCPKCGFQFDS
jgi:hypothetical protein